MEFLDKDGLATLWAKIKAKFAAKEHSHSGYATTSALTSLETNISNALNGKASSSHTHSSYVNQNAFSNVKVGNTTIAADTTTDTLTLVAGSNVTITPDATNDKITIAATNTTYSLVGTNGTSGLVKNGSSVTSSTGYTACPIISGVPYYKDTNSTYSLSSFGITATAAELNFMDGVTSNVQTQLDGKAPSSHSHSSYVAITGAQSIAGAKTFSDGITIGSAGGLTIEGVIKLANGINAPTSSGGSIFGKGSSGQVLKSNGSGVYWASDNNTTYSAATTSAAGLMSAADKSKLDAITASADSVSISRSLTSGTKIGTITVNGSPYDLYAPSASSGGSTIYAHRIYLEDPTATNYAEFVLYNSSSAKINSFSLLYNAITAQGVAGGQATVPAVCYVEDSSINEVGDSWHPCVVGCSSTAASITFASGDYFDVAYVMDTVNPI